MVCGDLEQQIIGYGLCVEFVDCICITYNSVGSLILH